MSHHPPGGEIILYQRGDPPAIDVRLDGDTVWLSLNQIADLMGRDKSTISRHITNVFAEGELVRHSVVAEIATTAADGKTYRVEHFNLDVIISVGYRVKSQQGTQFRIWATHPPRVIPPRVIAGSTRNPGPIHRPRHPITPRVIPPRVIAGSTRNPGAIHHPRRPITPRVIPSRVIPSRVIPSRVIAGLTRNPGALPS